MKTIFRLTVLVMTLAMFYTENMHAQVVMNVMNSNEVVNNETIDNALFTVQYETTFLIDTLNEEKRRNETMILKIGKKNSSYYSYSQFLTDSIIEVDKKMGASIEVIQNHMKQYKPMVTYSIYKNYPSGKVTTLDKLGMSRFRCEEENEAQDWKLLPDTATILSYPCQKAVCSFRGREYEAWYTPEIPRSEGPWKLNGLPGLILKAKDSKGHYTFECTAITQSNGEDPVLFGGGNYEPISRKDLNKLYARFAADPIGYITGNSPNVTIRMVDADGKPAKSPKNMPFNPMELQ